MAEPNKLSQDTDRPPQPGGIVARALARGERTYLAGLNPEQRLAVETLYGPVLVLAGAGTGKTRVLTTRIAHILNLGRARPAEILAVTFTNKAAREMKARISAIMGEAVEGMPWLGTFHAIGVKILRRHAELVGLKPDFTILDTDDQVRLLKQLLEAEDIDEKRWPARVLATLIDGMEEPRAHPDKVPPERRRALPAGAAQRSTRPIRTVSRCSTRSISAISCSSASACSASAPRCCASTRSGSASCWSTNIRTPTSPNTCGCA